MTTPAPGRLLDVARQLLTAAAGILDAAGYTAPDRRFVAPGRVTTFPGCETLGVVVDRVYAGQPGLEQRAVPADCRQMLTGQFSVVLNRCVPTITDGGELPDFTVMDAAGAGLVEQGWALITGFEGLLSRSPAGNAIVGVAGPLEALQPAGGIGGWRLTINARL